MAQAANEQEGQPGPPITSTRATRWEETALIWVLVALGGGGLWLAASDPIFGGPEGDLVALTLFGFFVALGLVATVLIWWGRAWWERWMHRLPPEDEGRLDAARMASGCFFWVLALTTVVYTVSAHWHPVAIGTAAGGVLLARLLVEIWLHHRLGRRPVPLSWQALAELGRKVDAIQAHRRETGSSLYVAREAVEGYLSARDR